MTDREGEARRARARVVAERARAEMPEAVQAIDEAHGLVTLTVARDLAHDVLELLRDDEETPFDYLIDVTCVDWMKHPEPHPERFSVVWHLHSFPGDARIRVRAFVPEADPTVESAFDLWPAANWAEREAYDMYGVEFSGHPDLRRILMPDDYGSFPLRKDYPLKGRGERDAFPVITR